MVRVNPFNPQLPSRPEFFVGRELEIIEFEKFLNQTINNSPMNMAINGNRGMGKTSLLKKFEQMAKDRKCLVLQFSEYSDNKLFLQFSDFLLVNLKQEIESRGIVSTLKSELEEILNSIRVNYGDVKIYLEIQKKAPELLKKGLIKSWEGISKDYSAVVLLFDEAEFLEVNDLLKPLRNIFQDISEKANYIIVLSGKLNFPLRMSESYSPLNRFFPASTLNPLKQTEIEEYVIKKLETRNIKITQRALKGIVTKTEGHPYIVVEMCYTLFDSLRDDEEIIDDNVISRTNDKLKAKLAQNFFSPMYNTLPEGAKPIIRKLAQNDKIEFSPKDAIKITGINGSGLSPYLGELERRGILNKPQRAQYRFFHTLFLDFLKDLGKQV